MRQRTLLFLALILLLYFSSLVIMSLPFSVNEKTHVYSSKITYINNGEKIVNFTSNLHVFNIFMNTSWQTAYLEIVNNNYTLSKDADGNVVMVFDLPPPPPGRNVTISYSIKLEERYRRPPDIYLDSSGNLSDIPDEFKQKYCKIEGSWLVEEDLISFANSFKQSQGVITNILETVSRMADWIGSNVKKVTHDIPFYPNETYHLLEGDCDDQANLLIALCRALGIPAYLQVGCLKWHSKRETLWNSHLFSNLKDISYHAWAVVYVPPWGWLPFDMTLGWNPYDSLSALKYAVVWSLDTMPLFNVTESDWPGDGRSQKAKIMTSSIYIYREDSLITKDQKHLFNFLIDWRFWSIFVAILFVLVITNFKSRFFNYLKISIFYKCNPKRLNLTSLYKIRTGPVVQFGMNGDL